MEDGELSGVSVDVWEKAYVMVFAQLGTAIRGITDFVTQWEYIDFGECSSFVAYSFSSLPIERSL